jgi:hypothetical protein
MEAMERIGFNLDLSKHKKFIEGDPVAAIMSFNVHRRHLSKQERADAIVRWIATIEADNKPGQAGPVSEAKGGRGKRSPTKEKALAINAELPKEQQVSERTIKRAMAKAEGKTPAKPKPESEAKHKVKAAAVVATDMRAVERAIAEAEGNKPKFKPKPKELPDDYWEIPSGIEAAREHYAAEIIKLGGEKAINAELKVLQAEIQRQWRKRASTLPQDGRSERPVDDPTPENCIRDVESIVNAALNPRRR